jgi:hypothetical protein
VEKPNRWKMSSARNVGDPKLDASGAIAQPDE